ncbi:MAG TPA: PfkB family carbohydrate kinase [Trebonia sp.]|nr:PfkB family carbohydrate kinase [Trebonia sp.]
MITVVGEALVDLTLPSGSAMTPDGVPLRALPGRGALSIAVSVARLGYPVALMAHLSRDALGRLLRRYAAQSGVDVSGSPEMDEPTPIHVGPAAPGKGERATFYASDPSAWPWTAGDLAWISAETTIVHVGSLAWCSAASTARVLRAASRLRQRGALVCLDLAMCAEVMPTPGQGRVLLERALRSADVIQAGIEDIDWLYAGRAPQSVAEQWARLGAGLAIVSCGAAGVLAVRAAGSVVYRPAFPVDVVDPTGARDAFTAGVLTALHDHHQGGEAGQALPALPVADVLDLASVIAGMTCERGGANPPTAAELKERVSPSPARRGRTERAPRR